MRSGARGYFEVLGESIEPGALYCYRLNGGPDRPDPASRFQPQGVHGPSQVVSSDHEWHDGGWGSERIEGRQFVVFSQNHLWRKEIYSAEELWGGPAGPAPDVLEGHAQLALAPDSFLLYSRTEAH